MTPGIRPKDIAVRITTVALMALLASCGSPVKNNTASGTDTSTAPPAPKDTAGTNPTNHPTTSSSTGHETTTRPPSTHSGIPNSSNQPPPGPSSHSNIAVPAPVRVPLPLDGLFYKEFQVAKQQLASIIREACGDGTLCLSVGKAVDNDTTNDHPDNCDRVHFVRGAKDEGGRSYVTTGRGSEITLVLWSLCSDFPSSSSTSTESQAPAP